MLFGKKYISQRKKPQSGAYKYRGLLVKTLFFIWVMLTLFADFLANDRPILCSTNSRITSPVVSTLLSKKVTAQSPFQEKYDWAIWPLIPFAPNDLRLEDGSYLPPGVNGHILGTDQLGRDLASGIIHGARKAFYIGFLSMLLAAILGIISGAMAGYFGDSDCRMAWWILACILLIAGYTVFHFIQFSALHDLTNEIAMSWPIYLLSVLLIGIALFFREKVPGRKMVLPLDSLLLRLIELLDSIPKLLIILAVAAIWQGSSLTQIAILIGLLAWPEIARLIRGEILKLKEQGFVDASRVLGLSDQRIIWTHLVPNAMGPVLITLSFGVGSAILLEAFLSFLGIGLPEGEVTWGSMISQARDYFAAWWLALFPGISLFLAILSCTLLAEFLQSRLDPRYHSPHYLE